VLCRAHDPPDKLTHKFADADNTGAGAVDGESVVVGGLLVVAVVAVGVVVGLVGVGGVGVVWMVVVGVVGRGWRPWFLAWVVEKEWV
jgi:hypothetical protein